MVSYDLELGEVGIGVRVATARSWKNKDLDLGELGLGVRAAGDWS